MLFAAVHPLDVLLIVGLQLLALQLEGVGDQARLRRPRLGAQPDLLGDLKALQLVCITSDRTPQSVKALDAILCNQMDVVMARVLHLSQAERCWVLSHVPRI